MKYLLIGIWRGDHYPEVQRHSTDSKMSVEQAVYAVTRHAGRESVPDVVLMIGEGPECLYEWEKDRDIYQDDFDKIRQGGGAEVGP